MTKRSGLGGGATIMVAVVVLIGGALAFALFALSASDAGIDAAAERDAAERDAGERDAGEGAQEAPAVEQATLVAPSACDFVEVAQWNGYNVFFETGSADVSAAERKRLAEISKDLSDCAAYVIVEGHSHAKEAEGDTANIGWSRAAAVAKALSEANLPIAETQIADVGAEKPFFSGGGATHGSLNQRVTIRLSKRPVE